MVKRHNDGEKDIIVAISCDDSKAQLAQIKRRIQNYFLDSIMLVEVSDTRTLKRKRLMKETWKNDQKLIVMLCLDNKSQIDQLESVLTEINGTNKKTKEILLIHDEADVITKESIVDKIVPDRKGKNNKNIAAAKSHNQWILLVKYLDESSINMHRVFVSATPDNVQRKYKIDTLHSLDISPNYVGWENVVKFPRNDLKNQESIIQVLGSEIPRVNALGGGIILYCLERITKKTDRNDCGHSDQFLQINNYIDTGALPPCTVSTYNSKGIFVRLADISKNGQLQTKLDAIQAADATNKLIAKVNKTVYTFNLETNVFHINNLQIADFYELCKMIDQRTIITIGKDMMSRGISFVSSEYSEDCLAAITMISAGNSTIVAESQHFGRELGTARPDLVRHLYASPDSITNYENYNMNQARTIRFLQERINASRTSNDLMKDYKFDHYMTKSLDRPKVKCNEKYKTSAELASESDSDSSVNSIERENAIVNLYNRKTTTVSKILKFLYDQGTFERSTPISYEELGQGLNYQGTPRQLKSIIDCGCSPRSQNGKLCGKLWDSRYGIVRLEDNVREILDRKLQN
jgi:hypothetical protein